MIQINTIENYLQLFAGPGWRKKTHGGNNYNSYRAEPKIGKGGVKIYGDPHKFCYIKIDFCYTSDIICLFSVEEPYIEISTNLEDAIILNDAGNKNMVAEQGLNCHINLGNLKVSQFFPAGTKFRKESLVIREQFLREQMPTFIENEMFTMARAIRSGGIADPRIALVFKQLSTFPLNADYGQSYLAGKVYESIALLQDKVNQVQWDKPTLSPAEIERIKKTIFFIKKHYNKSPNITDLAKQFQLNRNKLQAGFHALTGYTVHECLLNIRVQESMTLLAASDMTIPDIAKNVGFNSAKSLYDAFYKFLGIPPNYLRKVMRK